MLSRSSVIFVLGSHLALSAASTAMAARSALDKPYLSDDLQAKLQELPYGISDQRSLFLRYKHIAGVHFYGGAQGSRFSFKRGQSVLNEGLSLRLVQEERSSWANAVISFRKPIDIQKYNSVVIWVWSSQPNMRLWVTLKGGAQAKTDILPEQGLPHDEPVQLVVPISSFSPYQRLNLARINQVILEFGAQTTGNPPDGAIQVLGIAFVEQANSFDRALMVLGRVNTNVVFAEPFRKDVMDEGIEIVPPVSEEEEELPKKNIVIGNWGYGLFLAALTGLWFMILRRGRRRSSAYQMGKILHEIPWPFSITQPVIHRKVEKEFWKGVAEQNEFYGWLSTTGLVTEKAGPAEYFGETFLKRQIQLAARAGIRLFPSLSFTTALFHKNMHPSNLERSSTAVRTLVLETLLRFSDIAAGVRIENACDLLSSKWRRKEGEPEFWHDIISAVKAKHPEFLFFSDGVGDQARLVREVGFDYYENNFFVDTLIDQLRFGKVGDARAFLRGESALHLNQSIYNISPLLRPSPTANPDGRENTLGAILLTLLPGVVQHDNNIPEELNAFIHKMALSPIVRNGHFALLRTGNPAVMAFARWRKKSLLVAVSNFSPDLQNDVINIHPLTESFDRNKLYLFNNALHGSETMKNLLNQPPSDGPALALWGQNLRDSGIPISIPGHGFSLFSVTLSKPVVDPGTIAESPSKSLASRS